MEEVFNRPCNLHTGGDGRPADQTKAQCNYYKKWKEESQHNRGNHHDANPGAAHNTGAGPHNAGNAKQAGQYHTIVIDTSKREDKLSRRSQQVNAIIPATPNWLRWSEHMVTWSHDDHPPQVREPGKLALVVAPYVGGYKLTKVLMDRGSSINILYYDTLGAPGLQPAAHDDRISWHRPRKVCTASWKDNPRSDLWDRGKLQERVHMLRSSKVPKSIPRFVRKNSLC